jgi:lysophospholipase L1-like esterase
MTMYLLRRTTAGPAASIAGGAVLFFTVFAALAALAGCASVSPPPPLPAAAPPTHDWANTQRYEAANRALAAPAAGQARVVFMGDSITDAWPEMSPTLFANPAHIGRGISAQTTPHMLVRMRSDVIRLQPAVVVILAGTNDIAGNTGPATVAQITDNIESMAQLARANGIRVVLASVLPASRYYWSPAQRPAATIVALNASIKALAARAGHVYLDMHTPLADADGGLPKALSDDGVHPSRTGYEAMRPLVQQAIAQALATR